MQTIKIIRLLHLLVYLILVSQLLYYLFVMGDAMKMAGIENFVEQRKIVDPLVKKRHIPFYYLGLALSILLLIFTARQWCSPIFICTLLSLLCLFFDLGIALKANVPINNLINETPIGDKGTNWEGLREKWIYFIQMRGAISAIGFISLLVALVFERK